MPSLISVLLAILNSLPLVASDQVPIPVVGQPPTDFYRAQGNRVRVEWLLDRTTVPEDEEIVATLVVTGVTNPREVVRPDLRKLNPFQSRFIIADNRDPMPAEGASEVRFSYRLRPRNRSVDRIPTLAFYYHNPAAAAGKEFPLTTAKYEGRITVTEPAPKSHAAVLPLAEPERLFVIATGPGVLGQPAPMVAWEWLAALMFGPLAATGWYLAWRQMYPDAARQARLRRTRAAHRAIDAFRRSGRMPEPAAAIAAAMVRYLQSRFPLPPGATTPTEIGAALIDLGHANESAVAVATFMRECDAARFGGSGKGAATLAADAEALVVRLEGAA